MTTTQPRSAVHTWMPTEPHQRGHGVTRSWTRVIRGRKYGFAAITMPDGELRWTASRFDAPDGSPNFGCYWTRLHFITIKPAPAGEGVSARKLSDVIEDFQRRAEVQREFAKDADEDGDAKSAAYSNGRADAYNSAIRALVEAGS